VDVSARTVTRDVPVSDRGETPLSVVALEPDGTHVPFGVEVTFPLRRAASPGDALWIATFEDGAWASTGERAWVTSSGREAVGRVFHFSDKALFREEPETEESFRIPSSGTATLGRLRVREEEQELSRRVQIVYEDVPRIDLARTAALEKAVSELPPPEGLRLEHLLSLYKIAGPKGVHWLYDKGLLSERHAVEFQRIRSGLNEDIIRHLSDRYGKVGVNNFGAARNCRSDHDQTIYGLDSGFLPKAMIDAYNREFQRRVDDAMGRSFGTFTPELVEISNFDGRQAFPDWRIVKDVAVFNAKLTRKSRSIPTNPEAYPLIGAFRESVDYTSGQKPNTFVIYERGLEPRLGDASLHVFPGLMPDRRRAHAAGAAIGNWYFHNVHGGGKDPIEQAKYLQRANAFGGYLITADPKAVAEPGFHCLLYEKIGSHHGVEGEELKAKQREYVEQIYGDEVGPEKMKLFRLALDVAANIRANKSQAVDPTTKEVRAAMLEPLCRELAKDSGRPWADHAVEAGRVYGELKAEMLTRLMLKSFPVLAADWLEPPRDLESLRRKLVEYGRRHGVDLSHLRSEEALRDKLAMTNYREMRLIFELVGRQDPDLLRRLMDSADPKHKKHLERLRASVDAEVRWRNAPPHAPESYFGEIADEVRSIVGNMAADARLNAWRLESFVESPRTASGEAMARVLGDMRQHVADRCGVKAAIEFDRLGRATMVNKFSVKSFLSNNINLANGYAVVHAMNAYLDAEAANPGSGDSAFRNELAKQLFLQLPWIGGLYDLKLALVDGNLMGITMNLACRYARGIATRYLAIGLAVEVAKVAVRLTGWVVFDQVAGDTSDKLYLGMLPAKEGGLIQAGNQEMGATYLPSILEVVDRITLDDRHTARFTDWEEEALDEDISRRAEKGEYDDTPAMRRAEKRRRMVWIWIQRLIDDELRRLGVVPESYGPDQREQYDADHEQVVTAMLQGGTARLYVAADADYALPLIDDVVRRFSRGELMGRPTDADLLASLPGHTEPGEYVTREIQARLARRLRADFLLGVEAHGDFLASMALAEQEVIKEHEQVMLKNTLGLKDALQAKAEEAHAEHVGEIVGKVWCEAGLDPMVPVLKLSAFIAEERVEGGEEGEYEEQVYVRGTTYGREGDHPLPWDVRLEILAPDKKRTETRLPPASMTVETDEDDEPVARFLSREEPTPLTTEGPDGVFVHTLYVRDALGAPMTIGTIGQRTPVGGEVVRAEVKRHDFTGARHVELSIPDVPPLQPGERVEFPIYRGASSDGPFCQVGQWEPGGYRNCVDVLPFRYALGTRTWYYACRTRRIGPAGTTVSALSPPTAVKVTLEMPRPEGARLVLEAEENTTHHGGDGAPDSTGLTRERFSAYVAPRFEVPFPDVSENMPSPSFSLVVERARGLDGDWFEHPVEVERDRDRELFTFTDATANHGRLYRYRFLFRGEFRFIGEPSDPIRVEMPPLCVPASLASTLARQDRPRETVPMVFLYRGQTIDLRPHGMGVGADVSLAAGDRVRPHGPGGMPAAAVARFRPAHPDVFSSAFRDEYALGALLGAFVPEGGAPATDASWFPIPEPTGFTAPADGWLGFAANDPTASGFSYTTFWVEAIVREDTALEILGTTAPPAVELFPAEGRHGYVELRPATGQYASSRPPARGGWFAALYVSEDAEGPWRLYGHDEPWLERFSIFREHWPLGDTLYFRARLGVTSDWGFHPDAGRVLERMTPASSVSTPGSMTTMVMEIPNLIVEFDDRKRRASNPSALIPVREGRRLSLTPPPPSTRWNPFEIDGLPDCGLAGLSADEHDRTVVKVLRERAESAGATAEAWVETVASGIAYWAPNAPPGALIVQYHSTGSVDSTLTLVLDRTVTIEAPADGVLHVRPNGFRAVPGDMARPRTSAGPGLAVQVTVD